MTIQPLLKSRSECYTSYGKHYSSIAQSTQQGMGRQKKHLEVEGKGKKRGEKNSDNCTHSFG